MANDDYKRATSWHRLEVHYANCVRRLLGLPLEPHPDY